MALVLPVHPHTTSPHSHPLVFMVERRAALHACHIVWVCIDELHQTRQAIELGLRAQFQQVPVCDSQHKVYSNEVQGPVFKQPWSSAPAGRLCSLFTNICTVDVLGGREKQSWRC